MRRNAARLTFCALLTLCALARAAPAQGRVEPRVTSRVRPEARRDARLTRAVVAALYEGQPVPRTDRARYYYNRADLDADGRPETLVYVFGPSWCGSAGCHLLLFRDGARGYELVSRVEGAENPVVVSRRRTNGWSDLVAYVRWGEVGGRTVRDYYAVLRFDGRAYPAQFPGGPPLEARVSGASYLGGDRSETSGHALRPPRGGARRRD
jgi:hypothetical protein